MGSNPGVLSTRGVIGKNKSRYQWYKNKHGRAERTKLTVVVSVAMLVRVHSIATLLLASILIVKAAPAVKERRPMDSVCDVLPGAAPCCKFLPGTFAQAVAKLKLIRIYEDRTTDDDKPPPQCVA